jgi:hypothetical protein
MDFYALTATALIMNSRTEYAHAQAADPGLRWSSMRSMQFWGMVLVICCCGGDTGLDATSESTSNLSSQADST